MASIVLLSIAIIPMVAMFDAGLESAAMGGNYDTARTLASTKLEEVKSLPFNSVKTKYAPGTTTTPPAIGQHDFEVKTQYLTRELEPSDTPTAYLSIDVTVFWAGGESSFETTGLKVRE